MVEHFMLLQLIHVLYSNVTTILYPVSCLVEIKLFQIGGNKGGRTSETQSHSHSCSFTSQPVIKGITSRMEGLKVDKLAVKGNNK